MTLQPVFLQLRLIKRAAVLAFCLVTVMMTSSGQNASGTLTNGSEIAQPGRTYVDLDFDWRFHKGEIPTGHDRQLDDSTWRVVQLPHDWSIEGPFGPEHASGTGYAPGGIAWYRKNFVLNGAARGKRVAVEFDGVYCNSEVWINGQFLGWRPNGYVSFQYDLTPYLAPDGENVLAVRVDHSKVADSRWYTGSGIYRHVRLRITEPLAVAHWGTFITTPEVSNTSATVRVQTELENYQERAQSVQLRLTIIDSQGIEQAMTSADVHVNPGRTFAVTRELKIDSPQRWSTDNPNLYQLRTELLDGSRTLDATTTSFGIRSFRFDPNDGFFLNDRNMKLKGVCLHHDAGSLGAAVPDKVLLRRLELMKELGANAIRTAHNPPAPELLDMCDRLGLLVQLEAFDEFTPPKNKWVKGRNVGRPAQYGYAQHFDIWAVRDMQDIVRRDRNHPCIIMWSIGNEIDYPNDPFTHPQLGDQYRPTYPRAERLVEQCRQLVEAVKEMDDTRPVTAALAALHMSNEVGLPQLFDAVGYNYQEARYAEDHKRYPLRVIYGSENDDAYDRWLAVKQNDYISGQFLWTGIDYLGEANEWPRRVFPGGVLDLATFRKPLAWWRQSLWTEEPIVFLAVQERRGRGRRGFRWRRGAELRAHWNWSEGSDVTVHCCTTCDEVDLYLNGKWVRTLTAGDEQGGWRRITLAYQPGRLEAVGRNGPMELCRFGLQTAGPAQRIHVASDTNKLRADGKDIAHLQFFVVDEQGIRVPDAEHEVEFSLDGPIKILGIDDGRLEGEIDYQDHVGRAFRGRGLAIVQAQRDSDRAKIRLSGDQLESAEVILHID